MQTQSCKLIPSHQVHYTKPQHDEINKQGLNNFLPNLLEASVFDSHQPIVAYVKGFHHSETKQKKIIYKSNFLHTELIQETDSALFYGQ